MTMDQSQLEIRKLPPSHISQLSTILESEDQWKKLMAIVPNILKRDFNCLVDCNNPPKYNLDHIRLIEAASQKYKRTGTEILLEEWGCSGRIRPAVGHLLHLLVQAELFRAADYVAVNILKQSPPKRPTHGPAALIPTDMNGHIMEGILNEIDYSNSVLDNITLNSFNKNLDLSEKRSSIPEIIVTPDCDQYVNPNFNTLSNTTNDENENQEASSMIKFSSINEASTESISNVSEGLSSDSAATESESNTLNDSELINSRSNNVSTQSNEGIIGDAINGQIESDGDNIPNLSTLNQQSEVYIPNISGLIGNSSECIVPNLSCLNQAVSMTERNDNIPNLSGLNQPVISSENGVSISDLSGLNQRVISSENGDFIPNLSKLIGESDQISGNVPNISELISEDSDTPTTISNSAVIPNISAFTSISTEAKAVSKTVSSQEDDFLPNFSLFMPDTTRRSSLNVSTNTFNSSKSRQCTSPLPNLTLNTHLPHVAFEELRVATNNFNEDPVEEPLGMGRFLGAGAFGKVFLAKGLFDKPVAVKKILLDNAEVVNVDDAVTRQFTNEVEVLSKFRHENLLLLLGYSCDGCTYCILYEYISGGTLKDRLQNKKQTLGWEERLAVIALGTAKAISYLHTAFSSPLIHRDVKTANILLDCSNKPKLGDFGITKLLKNPTSKTGTVVGTSAYMAAEALRGEISVKCDTFSFGVVLLELLTSLPAYDEQRDGNVLISYVEEQCEDSIDPLLDTSVGSWTKNGISFSDELYQIATKCLEEKKKRPVMVDVTKMLIDLVDKLS